MAVQLTAILFALRREARPFLRSLHGLDGVREAPCPAWRSEGELLVLVTGMGRAATERALDWVLTQSPRRIVSAGYCGSLEADLVVGEVCQPRRVVRPNEDTWLLSPSSGVHDTLVSVDHPVLAIEDRLALHRQTGARVVDMESATVVERGQAAGVPCQVVRVVSDDFAHPLPADLLPVFEGERVHYPALLSTLCRAPRRVVDLLRLARDTRRASVVLAGVLRQLLTAS